MIEEDRWYNKYLGEINLQGLKDDDLEEYFATRTRLIKEGWKPVKKIIQLPDPSKIMGFDIIINTDLPMNEFLIDDKRYRINKDGSLDNLNI